MPSSDSACSDEGRGSRTPADGRSGPAPDTAPTARPMRVVAGAALLNMCLGSLYAWSVFVEPLQDEFGWSGAEVSVVFAASLVVFCGTTVLAGRSADRRSPRRLAMAAAVCAGIGLACSAMAASLWMLVLTYAGVFGVGNGLGYVTAVAAAGRAMPQRRGTGVGVAVAGYALGPLLVAGPAVALMGTLGWRAAFIILGCVLTLVMLAAAMLLGPPVSGDAPGVSDDAAGVAPMEMVSRVEAHLLWATFALGSFAALMTVGHTAPLAASRGLSPAAAGTAVGVVAAGNAVGRVLAGPASDIAGRRRLLVAAMAGTVGGASWLAFASTAVALLSALAVVGLTYGALASLVPAATGDLFGARHFGANFGVIFTAWGTAGLVAAPAGGWVAERTSYAAALLAGGVVALAGLICALLLARRDWRLVP